MDNTALGWQAVLAIAMPRVLQWLKGKTSFPLLSYTSGKLNFWITGLIASLTSFGIHFVFNAGAGTLLITGLTTAGLWAGIQHAALQWAAQHFVYKTTIAPTLPGAVQATIRAEPTKTIVEPMAGAEGPAKDPKAS